MTPALTPETPAAEVLLEYLRARREELLSAQERLGVDEAEAVHDMRVAARRFRSVLQAFRPLLRSEESARLVEELRWAGRMLGASRDNDVVAERLYASVSRLEPEVVLGPVKARVVAHYAPRSAAARTAVLEGLDSERYAALLASMDVLLADPPLTPKSERPGGAVLPRLAGRAFRRVRRRAQKAFDEPLGEKRDADLHQTRKAAKRARYAAEAVSPAVRPKAAKATITDLKELQSALGEHQDAVMSAPDVRLLGLQAHAAGENAFTYGLLWELESESAAASIARGESIWRKANSRKRTAWMR